MPRHRARSTLLALVVAAAPFAAPFGAPLAAQTRRPVYTPGALDPNQQLAREIYKELIEINSGVTTGNVTTAANAMARRFRDAGFPEQDIFVGGPRPDKHNVVLRIHGKGGAAAVRKPLLLLAHLDVVEALKSDWSPDLDPFVFTERDGYYYGRGTADDKAMAAIFAANAIRMKRDGLVPERDVIVALTADEESGPANGAEWLVKNHRDLVDAGLVINEGGGGVLRDGKPLFNTVQVAQKITMNFTLRATNRGGHSSVPRDDNAITSLADALSKVGRHHFPVKLSDVTREFFTRTADLETPEMARAMRALTSASLGAGVATPNDAAAVAVVAKDDRYSALLRTTCVATMLAGGHATNALPQLAEANINCRVYPDETAEQVRAALERVVGDTAVQVLVKTQRPSSPPAPLPGEIMAPVRQITRELFGDIPVIPTMSTGANDSRFFLTLGVPAYGVSGLFSDPRTDARAHGRDERMRVQSFFEGQEFLWRLTRALTSGTKPVS